MLRALFRRLTLAASLIVLVSVSLFAGVPAASARSQASLPACTLLSDLYQHCYVALNITAPPLDASSGISNLGVSSDMQIFNPPVGKKDLQSVAQMTAFGCYPDCTNASLDIEFGWIVAPHSTWTYPPQANKPSGLDSFTHLLVYVRSSTAPEKGCLVQYTGTGWNGQGWTCGWNSFYPGGSSDYPGEVLATNASQPPVGHFVIVYSNGNWWLGYNNNWIGNVDGSWFGGLFNSVGEANWQGEVAVNAHSLATQMGDGVCGTMTTTSAHISNMMLAESGFTISARDPALYPSLTVTNKHSYNGYDYTPPGTTNSILSYGGPKGC